MKRLLVALPPRGWPIEIGAECWLDAKSRLPMSATAKALYDRLVTKPAWQIAAIWHGIGRHGFIRGIWRGRHWLLRWRGVLEVPNGE